MDTTPHRSTVPHVGKFIYYDTETRDYALYFDGILVGYARTSDEATRALDTYVYNLLTHAVMPAPLDCADLSATFRRSKYAAARLLLTLTPAQLARQALAYATHVNELHGLDLTMDDMLENWQRGMARIGVRLEAA